MCSPIRPPDPHKVLDHCQREGMTHVILDGTLIESDRVAGVRDNGNDLWFSKKHKAFGGNVQFLATPDGTPQWASGAEPGSTPDITAARIHALPALYKAAADGPVDHGGQRLRRGRNRHPRPHPKRQPERAPHADTRTTNILITGTRALGERTAAALKQRWRTLQHITLNPGRIGDITRAALVLNAIWK